MGVEKLLYRLEQPHGTGDLYLCWQNGSGMYFATTGIDQMVNIFDKYGQIKDRVRLPSLCVQFQWDSDGDILAILCQSPVLILWDSNSSSKSEIPILNDLSSCLSWARNDPILIIGTTKGNMLLYNHNTTKKSVILGKHTKAITCAAWNIDNVIALGSDDKSISINNKEGDSIKVLNVRLEPSDIQFSEMKLDERMGGENTISVVLGKRILYLYNLLDPDNPVELAFQQHYGQIVSYKWYGDGYILIGFSKGYFVSISTHLKEVGQEIFQVRNHKVTLNDIAVCNTSKKAASCGDNTVKIHDLSNLRDTSSVLTFGQETGLSRIAWSIDGQLLAICTNGGSLSIYVTNIPLITSVCVPRMAILSNLTEIQLYTYVADKTKLHSVAIKLEVEPSFFAVGPHHIAAGMNNKVWFYDITKSQPGTDDSPYFLRNHQYVTGINNIKLNDKYAAVHYEGKVLLHKIESNSDDVHDSNTFSLPNVEITCHSLTDDFLVYATLDGKINYFPFEEWSVTCEFKHTFGITQIFPDASGTRLVFIDQKSDGYVYNAALNEAAQIPQLPNDILGVTWDSNIDERHVFIIFNGFEIATYIYVKMSIYGSSVQRIGQTVLVSKQIPLIMFSGEIVSASVNGKITQLLLSTHDDARVNIKNSDSNVLESNLHKQLALHRFESAFDTCKTLNNEKNWRKLAHEAMIAGEICVAIRVFREINDISMVLSLQEIKNVEESKILYGYLAMYLNEFSVAQNCFLSSTHPQLALEMRRDLLQWDEALQLAKKMAPEQIALISREYAQQLEFTGNYSEAYIHYEKALQGNLSDEHTFQCKAGMVRSGLHSHNYRNGISMALELNNTQLMKECAEILEKNKQYSEAAQLFEKCNQYDAAATSYIKLKQWSKISALLPHITSNHVRVQYAKAKEQEGKYQEAAQAYYDAKDTTAAIRLYLERLNNLELATEIVEETKNLDGAKMVANFYQKKNDYNSALQFLVMSHCFDDALNLARHHNKMQILGEILLNTLNEDEIRPRHFSSIAQHFEMERNFLLGGKYWFHARNYTKAMDLLLRATNSPTTESEALSLAIDVASSADDDKLTTVLIEFLLGENDGLPKDPKYLFRLYMARKQYTDAAKSAIIIANEEQINGNYRNAHDLLFEMYQELRRNSITVPNEMRQNLMLLHSYILVKLHHRRGDHLKAARMLIRVADNISKFPSHIVPILTSAVIECQRVGLKVISFKYAAIIIGNMEYRKQIDSKYVKKIESVVRKRPKSEYDHTEPLSPCPYCEHLVSESDLNCTKCKNTIPYCIVTGRHIDLGDLTACPECDFPALRTPFIEILDSEEVCPMCSKRVDSKRLLKIDDYKSYIFMD